MKNTMKKCSMVVLGVLCGILFSGGFVAAQITPEGPGKPKVHTDPTGSERVTGGKAAKFGNLQDVGLAIINFIEKVIVPLIMSLAVLVFVWGIMHYIKNGGDPSEREQGRQFMLWGIVGLAVMVSVWGLVRILTSSIGVPTGLSVPSLPPKQ